MEGTRLREGAKEKVCGLSSLLSVSCALSKETRKEKWIFYTLLSTRRYMRESRLHHPESSWQPAGLSTLPPRKVSCKKDKPAIPRLRTLTFMHWSAQVQTHPSPSYLPHPVKQRHIAGILLQPHGEEMLSAAWHRYCGWWEEDIFLCPAQILSLAFSYFPSL